MIDKEIFGSTFRLIPLSRLLWLFTLFAGTISFREVGISTIKRKGHFALYNCLVLGHKHTMGSEPQSVFSDPFSKKPFYESRCMDLVMLNCFVRQILKLVDLLFWLMLSGMSGCCFCSWLQFALSLLCPCIDSGNLQWSWKWYYLRLLALFALLALL